MRTIVRFISDGFYRVKLEDDIPEAVYEALFNQLDNGDYCVGETLNVDGIEYYVHVSGTEFSIYTDKKRFDSVSLGIRRPMYLETFADPPELDHDIIINGYTGVKKSFLDGLADSAYNALDQMPDYFVCNDEGVNNYVLRDRDTFRVYADRDAFFAAAQKLDSDLADKIRKDLDI